MRVTQQMMMNAMKYWLSKRSESLYQAEIVNGSGKIINKPSDDPASSGQILNDRTTLSQYGQYQSNLSQALNWFEACTNVMDVIYDLLDQAKDIATDQSAGDLDTRNELIITLESIYAQVVDLANTPYGGSYLFSGEQTNTKPFANETEVTGGIAEDLIFDLAGEASSLGIEITDQSGEVVRTLAVSGGVAGTNTITWDGLDDTGQPVADGVYQYTISASDTSGLPVTSCHTYRGDAGDKEVVLDQDSSLSINTDGGDIFSPVLMAISQAVSALEADPFDQADLETKADGLLDVLNSFKLDMVDLAMAGARLTTAQDKINRLYATCENRIAGLETAEADQAAIDLQNLQTAYEITLETVSKILSTNNLISMI